MGFISAYGLFILKSSGDKGKKFWTAERVKAKNFGPPKT
jgi:hypothetical protein